MPPLNLYDVSIVPMTRVLHTLSNILKKGEAFANTKGISHAEFLDGRIAPDMKELPFQIQSASSSAKFLAVRVAGVENESWDDTEKTFDELQALITRALKFLDNVKREDFEGKEGVEVTLRGMKYTGLSYTNEFAMPNFFFHAVTAYDILRMKGVDIGKADWLALK